jgi:hypothetical protein
VIAFDDRVRAAIGEQSIEGALGTIREGRVALVSRGGGRFLRLLVTGLDAWRFHAHTSRYDDFAEHIESFDGVLGVLEPGDAGAPTATVANLRAQTGAEIPRVMTQRADAEVRQRLFETWTTSLGLPLRESPRLLSLTRWVEDGATSLLVLESDEPLPFSSDVTLALSKRTRLEPWPLPMPDLPVEIQQFLAEVEYGGEDFTGPELPKQLRAAQRILRAEVRHGLVIVEVFEIEIGPDRRMRAKRGQATAAWPDELDPPNPGDFVVVDDQGHPLLPPLPSPAPILSAPVETQILTDGDEIRALIVPAVPLTAGTYRLALAIDRPRWRTATPDAASNYRTDVTVPLTWS